MQDQATFSPRDNLFGVCHAIGTAFGFDPLILRIAFAVALLFDFELAIGAYAALGIAVLAAVLSARWANRSSGERIATIAHTACQSAGSA